MSAPFPTSLRRDPGDSRGLKERIDGLLRERLEEAIDSACLDLLVRVRRERGLPAPVAGSAHDRAEFESMVLAFLGLLESAMTAGLTADERARLASGPSTESDDAARLIAVQVSLAKLLPDYWQRFEAVRADLGRLRGQV